MEAWNELWTPTPQHWAVPTTYYPSKRHKHRHYLSLTISLEGAATWRYQNNDFHDLNNKFHQRYFHRKRQPIFPSHLEQRPIHYHLPSYPKLEPSSLPLVRAILDRVFNTFYLELRWENSRSSKKYGFATFVKWVWGMRKYAGEGLRGGRVVEGV